MSEHTSATDEPTFVISAPMSGVKHEGGMLHIGTATVYSAKDHGIYRVADVEALVEFFAAVKEYDECAADEDQLAGSRERTFERCGAAAHAITPDLLARCRREPR